MPVLEATKYQQVADFVAALVEGGTLSAGMRAPSLRELSRAHRVSLGTAQAAFRLLEDRGVLEARPRAGFFVAANAGVRLGSPVTPRAPRRATPVSVNPVVVDLHEHSANPSLVPLGCAVPDPQLLAAGRLDRVLARVARVHGVAANTYAGLRGDARLRTEIARRAARHGHLVDPDDVVISCGCTEALSLAVSAVVPRGGAIAIESPAYFGLLQVLEHLGVSALELPVDAELGLDPARLDAALARGEAGAVLLSSSFHNPLGYLSPEPRRRELVEVATMHGVPLIEDDIYGDVHHGAERPRPLSALGVRGADILYCSSFSKTLAPGYRVGWLIAPSHESAVLKAKAALTLSGPVLAQLALGEYLASGGYDAHLRRLRAALAHNVACMLKAVESHFPRGTRVSRPRGGFVLWVQLPSGVEAGALYADALEAGICFAPGEVFTTSKRYRDCLRLSCGHAFDARIEGAVRWLGQRVTACIAGGAGRLASAATRRVPSAP